MSFRKVTPEARNLLVMLFAISLTLAVIHALAYVEGRHRWAIEPLLLLLTARGFFAAGGTLRSVVLAHHLRVLGPENER